MSHENNQGDCRSHGLLGPRLMDIKTPEELKAFLEGLNPVHKSFSWAETPNHTTPESDASNGPQKPHCMKIIKI